MCNRLIPLAIIAALGLPAGGAAAGVQLIEAGLVCPAEREAVETVPAPGTEFGTVDTLAGTIEFDLPDRAVPLVPLVGFGIRIALDAGEDALSVSTVIEHPPLGARDTTRQSWEKVLFPGETSVSLYTFDFPYEMVPGRWTFAIEAEGERLLEVPFDVGAPGAAARLDAVCLSQFAV